MRAEKLIKYLEDTISSRWVGKRFEDMIDVHNQVEADVNIIVAEHGLKFKNWGVRDENRNIVIQVKPIYNEDKRSKYKVKGRMIKVLFEPVTEIDDKTTVEDLILEKKKIEIKNNIERLKVEIEREKKELQESEQALENLEKELKTLA